MRVSPINTSCYFLLVRFPSTKEVLQRLLYGIRHRATGKKEKKDMKMIKLQKERPCCLRRLQERKVTRVWTMKMMRIATQRLTARRRTAQEAGCRLRHGNGVAVVLVVPTPKWLLNQRTTTTTSTTTTRKL
jgi:hypothetical protein